MTASDFLDASITFSGRIVRVDLTSDEAELSESAVEKWPRTVFDPEAFDRSARAAIANDARSGDAGLSHADAMGQ